MRKIRVVVDSATDFHNPALIERHRITIVPGTVIIGDDVYIDRQQMDAESFFKRIGVEDVQPRVQAPSVEQFTQAYTRLAQETDQIISLHTSSALSDAYQNALAASRNLLGRCDIAVVDSQTSSAGLALLAELAAKAAEHSLDLDQVVRDVRGAISRVYTIFYVDTLDYIQRQALLGEAQAILGTMLNIKPFLTIEEGHLVAMEKVRNRNQAVDKLVEFVLEFGEIDQLVILQNSPFTTEAVRMLQERLQAEFGRRNFPAILYGPTLGCWLGPDATGIAVLEKELDDFDDLPEDE